MKNGTPGSWRLMNNRCLYFRNEGKSFEEAEDR